MGEQVDKANPPNERKKRTVEKETRWNYENKFSKMRVNTIKVSQKTFFNRGKSHIY
jgi:hypothetical protein